jgi:hypothetical protein
VPTQERNATRRPPNLSRVFGPPNDTARHLSYYEQEYQRTRNRVYIWESLACALSRGVPLPDWAVPYLREVVGWAVSAVNDRHVTINALEMALKRRCSDAGLLHHSDQGCHVRE